MKMIFFLFIQKYFNFLILKNVDYGKVEKKQ